MSALPAERTPVIIGVGDLADRPTDYKQGREALVLIADAAKLADADAGGGWLPRITRIDVINQVGWAYTDLAASVKEAIGATHAVAAMQEVGGETPVKYLMKSAARIAEGADEVTLICGGEAFKTFQENMKLGKPPAHWSKPDPNVKGIRAEDYVTKLSLKYGLVQPIDVYPIYENACRHAWGQTFDEGQQESAQIWADFSQVAAKNPAGWFREPMSAEAINTIGPKNRPIAHPYLKNMVANWSVNQSAAFLVTSLANARKHGVPADKIVYVWSGAGACEPDDFLSRDSYTHSTAMDAVLNTTLEANGLKTSDLAAVELYSCFPTVPKMARRTLGLPESIVPTVTGGLTAFGGPLNNYMGHAIVAMARTVRGSGTKRGLVFGQGAFVTKHHAAVLSNQAPSKPVQNIDAQAKADAARGPVPPLLETYEGPAQIETFTVKYKRNGDAEMAPIVARTPDGARVPAMVMSKDLDTLVELTSGAEMVGRKGRIAVVDGVNQWTFDAFEVPKWTSRTSPVRLERVGEHVALVILNRPGARNAVNGGVTKTMGAIIEHLEQDKSIRAVVLASSIPEVFCAGADLAAVSQGKHAELMGKWGFGNIISAPRTKPWIAAVTGFALGGGTEIPLALDLIVAGKGTQFGLPEVKRGLVAAAAGTYRLPRAIPRVIAAEIALTGEPISAQRAYDLGLVNKVVDDADVRAEALRMAQAIADNAPLAVQASLKILRNAHDMTEGELLKLTGEVVMPVLMSKDLMEGTKAFLEKRKPKWKGE